MIDLSDLDTLSSTWRVVKDWAEAEKNSAFAELIVPGTLIDRTEFLRGRIETAEKLLALTDTTPQIVTSDTPY